eukprot:CAMPEP_0172019768 /NCGR_PEP_ID=MMETSP1041-20130122/12827_1 /TAXON_ID=464988 /ORGANISM="Hemiselmis andersenii, Strain CCMP439" /LENGTH=45 /DNA_ID= /DNA_START= /DNA_END= /DNA_ORIENTATION=
MPSIWRPANRRSESPQSPPPPARRQGARSGGVTYLVVVGELEAKD